MNPLHAAHYADQAVQQKVRVTAIKELAQETYRIRLACPAIAATIRPGQFIMVRQPASAEPLLGRAFALYDVVTNERGERTEIDVVFHIVGKLTRLLSQAVPGDELEVWGPLGNGFLPLPTDHLIMVAGGIGQTPFLALAKEYLGRESYGREVFPAERVTLCYGARSEKYLAGVPDFEALQVAVRVSTDDGSYGKHGLVTTVLKDLLDSDSPTTNTRVVTCGPEPMMAAVAKICADRSIPCQASLETPMACGIGICFSCVTKVMQPDGEWDFKRTCVDGPVFDAEKLVWT